MSFIIENINQQDIEKDGYQNVILGSLQFLVNNITSFQFYPITVSDEISSLVAVYVDYFGNETSRESLDESLISYISEKGLYIFSGGNIGTQAPCNCYLEISNGTDKWKSQVFITEQVSGAIIEFGTAIVTNAVQGQVSNHQIPLTNTGIEQDVVFDITFNFDVPVTQQKTITVPVGASSIDFDQLIPIDEGTPRTATLTDDVGSTPYSWTYAIEEASISFAITGTASLQTLVLGAATTGDWLIDWGEGSGYESITLGTTPTNQQRTYAVAGQYNFRLKPDTGADWADLNSFRNSSAASSTSEVLPVVGELDLRIATELSECSLVGTSGTDLMTKAYVKATTCTLFRALRLNECDINLDFVEIDNNNTNAINFFILGCAGDITFTIDENVLCKNGVYFRVGENAGLVQIPKLTNLNNDFYFIQVRDNTGGITYDSFRFASVTFSQIYFDSSVFDSATVDNILIDQELSFSVNSITGKVLNVSGSNAARTSASDTAVSSIQALGNTVASN